MPDLPELYEALDEALDVILEIGVNQRGYTQKASVLVSALCAAIEVKQTQEFHDMLNDNSESDALWDRMDKLSWELPSVEKTTTTTETQEEA